MNIILLGFQQPFGDDIHICGKRLEVTINL